MVCDNESASGEEKEGGSETYQVPSTYKFLTFLLENLHHLCEFTLWGNEAKPASSPNFYSTDPD